MDEKLPEGWAWTTIGDVAETSSGGTPSRSHPEYYSGTIPWVKSGELNDGIVSVVEEFLSEKGLNNSSAKLFHKGINLVAMYGATVGKTGILGIDATTNQAICAILPVHEAFLAKYMTYWLQFQRQELIGLSAGGAQPNINQEIIRSFPLPLSPLPEQSRIVAAIEQQFTRLDSAVASLRSARAKVKQYHASLLKAAVEGELTREWRAGQPASETGAQLLARILAERRARWEEEQLAKMRAKGLTPQDEKWKLAYKEPQGPDVAGLPELPEGWCWATVEQVIIYLRNGLPHKPEIAPPGYRILRINAVRPMKVDLEEARYLPLSEMEAQGYFIDNGDILFTRYNGSLDLLGVAGMVRGCIEPTLHPDKLIRVKTVLKELASYLEVTCNVGASRSFIERRARTTAGQTGISGSDIKQVPIPLPSLAEQAQIVAEVEARLSNLAELEQTIEHSLKRAEQERQSILREAFAGRLVAQNPEDEPASVLLERIRDERERRVGSEKGARRVGRTRNGNGTQRGLSAPESQALGELRRELQEARVVQMSWEENL